MFRITFLPGSVRLDENGRREMVGHIAADFVSPLAFWDRGAYERSWRGQIAGLVSGADRACLITKIAGPPSSVGGRVTFAQWWALYRVGLEVRIQEHVLFTESGAGGVSLIPEGFDPGEPHRWLKERETLSEDGRSISEWSCAFAEIEEFA